MIIYHDEHHITVQLKDRTIELVSDNIFDEEIIEKIWEDIE